jgi:DNA processing protein
MSEAGGSGARLTDAQRLDWLRLIRTESIGPQTFRSLVNRYGGAAAALDAVPRMAAQKGRSIVLADMDACKRELDGLAAMGARLVAMGEPEYPKALRVIHAPPPLISVLGDISVLSRPMVAVIGSRNASAAGLAFTERVVRDLAAAGFVIASGLARGVDARAHHASIGMGTVAALAGGLDKIYPPEHVGLAQDICGRGALIGEMPLGWEPRGRDFPRRNRIVAGLALGTLVIEASRGSGSLITAKYAADEGREIFAVPGSPLDPRAEGTNQLLRDGATLCTRAEDVLSVLLPMAGGGEPQLPLFREDEVTPEHLWDEFDQLYEVAAATPLSGHAVDGLPPAPASTPARTPREATHGKVLRAHVESLLGPSPVALDDLVRACGAPVAEVRSALLDLELDGRIERHGGGLVSLLPAR